MRLVYDGPLEAWAIAHIPDAPENPFGPCAAIGVESDGELIAVCVYHRYVQEYRSCEISFAATSPRWATRGNIRALLSVPFEQYNCYTICTCTPASNARAHKFNEGIGLIHPVVIRHGCGPNKDLIVRSMTREEYHARYGYTRKPNV